MKLGALLFSSLLVSLSSLGQGTMPLNRAFLQTSLNGNQKSMTNVASLGFSDGTSQSTAASGGGVTIRF